MIEDCDQRFRAKTFADRLQEFAGEVPVTIGKCVGEEGVESLGDCQRPVRRRAATSGGWL
jgi:hypothetical protein